MNKEKLEVVIEVVITAWGLPDALADELRLVFKDFHKQILEEYIKTIEGMKIITPDKKSEFTEEEMDGYNFALSEIINKLKE